MTQPVDADVKAILLAGTVENIVEPMPTTSVTTRTMVFAGEQFALTVALLTSVPNS